MSHKAFRQVTFTYAVEPTLDEGWRHVEVLRRRMAAAGVLALIVVQWGDKHGRIHFHAAINRYVDKAQLEAMWTMDDKLLGWVDVREIRARSAHKRVTRSSREHARVCAGYLAGYLKAEQRVEGAQGRPEADEAPPPGPPDLFNRRRYSVPKGTEPATVRFVAFGLWEALAQVTDLCGFPLDMVWQSDREDPEWRGPPTSLWRG